jgi:hypothetical protein
MSIPSARNHEYIQHNTRKKMMIGEGTHQLPPILLPVLELLLLGALHGIGERAAKAYTWIQEQGMSKRVLL